MRKYRNGKTGKIFKGLALIHIGVDVWKIGKEGVIIKEGKRILHQIIYGPDDKEYHLYKSEIVWLSAYHNQDSASAKVYILTHILDDRKNWCFDLGMKPETGEMVKVIYGNGTVKNIIFSGEFEQVAITRNLWRDEKIIMSLSTKKFIFPIAYRIK